MRQAKWIGRLRDLITEPSLEGSREARLYRWASIYAGIEKAALALNQRVETSDIDAALLIEGRTYYAVTETGLAGRFTSLSRLNALVQSDGQLAREQVNDFKFFNLPRDEFVLHIRQQTKFSSTVDEVWRGVIRDVDALTDNELEKKVKQVRDAVSVCAVWLSAISRNGRKWDSVPIPRRREILLAINDQSIKYHTDDHRDSHVPGLSAADDGVLHYHFRPSDEILDEIGYEPPDESNA